MDRVSVRVALLVAVVSGLACGRGGDGEPGGVLGRVWSSLSSTPRRPSLVNLRILTPQQQSSHALSLDGRIIVGCTFLEPNPLTSVWKASVFRPEAVTYAATGVPSFENAHSPGQMLTLHAGENAVSFCFADPAHPYTMSGERAVYTPWLVDSQMLGGDPVFRRRSARIEVTAPFTADADVAAFTLTAPTALRTQSGGAIYGIEPAMTGDGRLLIYQGGPSNSPAEGDHMMYVYNDTPCAEAGWSEPRPLSAMNSDPRPGLRRYPISWQPLRAATGEAFDAGGPALIRGAYPWVDPEGRDLLYASVMFTDGARREAMTFIGVDTHHTAYHIDGAINTSRYDIPHLFYSSPMWQFERERHPSMSLPPGQSRLSRYLPITKTHDVLPLFGGNTNDYNEVDLAEINDPFLLLYLPLNELVTRGGEYDLARTPDISGRHYTGALTGGATIDPDIGVTAPSPSTIWQPHGKGRALRLTGGGAVFVNLTPSGPRPTVGDIVRGLSVELSVRPSDAPVKLGGCAALQPRVLLQQAGALELLYHPDSTVEMSFAVGSQWVTMGKSPPLAPGAWSHLAFTWDGVTGELSEYVNAVSTGRKLPTVTGAMTLQPGTLAVGGAGPASPPPACPGATSSFVGHIDDLRIYTHARSQRSVCLGVTGVDCKATAIQEPPSGGQFVINHQNPACRDPESLATLACQSALHRVCAQRGAIDALSSTNNLWQTVLQLIGDRPPVSMLGVPTWASASGATIACAPIQHHSLAITYTELARRHSGCSDDRAAASLSCMAAAHRFCADPAIGYNTGHLFESTTRAWVGCFDSDFIDQVPQQVLGPVSATGNFEATGSRLEVSAWCMFRGFEGGVVQEVSNAGVAEVHCFHAPAVVPWSFLP